jgi:hypothetical protein
VPFLGLVEADDDDNDDFNVVVVENCRVPCRRSIIPSVRMVLLILQRVALPVLVDKEG